MVDDTTLTPSLDPALIAAGKSPLAPKRSSTYDKFQPADANWTLDQLSTVKDWHAHTFGKPLPLANIGQGTIHNKLGYDHRNSADVSINPTSPEGTQLREFLKSKNIPFLAFDRAVPGVATGPHIHVGYPSHSTSQKFGIGAQKKAAPSPSIDPEILTAAQSEQPEEQQQQPAPQGLDPDLLAAGTGRAPKSVKAPRAQKPLTPAQLDAAEAALFEPETKTDAYGRPVSQATGTIRNIISHPNFGNTAENVALNEQRKAIRRQVAAEHTPSTVRGVIGRGIEIAGLALDPVRASRELVNTAAENIDEETDRRMEAIARANTPEMIQARKNFGSLSPAARTASIIPGTLFSDAAKIAAGVVGAGGAMKLLHDTSGSEVAGYLAAKSKALQDAGNFMAESSQAAPLDENGIEKERARISVLGASVPAEKVARTLGGIGVTIGELVLLKKATGWSLSRIMGVETALKTSDLPAAERAPKIAEAAVMGHVLDQHWSRLATAGIFGGPTALSTGSAYAQHRMSGEDAALETVAQTAVGALMGGKRNALNPAAENFDTIGRSGPSGVPEPVSADINRVNQAVQSAASAAGITPESANRAVQPVRTAPEVPKPAPAPIAKALYIPRRETDGTWSMNVEAADGGVVRREFGSKREAIDYAEALQESSEPTGLASDTWRGQEGFAGERKPKGPKFPGLKVGATADLRKPASGYITPEDAETQEPALSDAIWADTEGGVDLSRYKTELGNRVDPKLLQADIDEALATGKVRGRSARFEAHDSSRGYIGTFDSQAEAESYIDPDNGWTQPSVSDSGYVVTREGQRDRNPEEYDRMQRLNADINQHIQRERDRTIGDVTAMSPRMRDAFEARQRYADAYSSLGREPRLLDPLRQAVRAIHADFANNPEAETLDWIKRNRPDLLSDYSDHEISEAIARDKAEMRDARNTPDDLIEAPDINMMRIDRGEDPNARLVAAGFDPKLIPTIAKNMYAKETGQIVPKELLQNAVDAVRSIPNAAQNGKVHLAVDTANKTFHITDNGVGMLPDVVDNQFTDLGGTLKQSLESSGGFGIAKGAMFYNAESIKVKTIARDPGTGKLIRTTVEGSGDEWLDPKRGLKVSSREVDPESVVGIRGTGTDISIKLKSDAAMDAYRTRSFLDGFIKRQKVPFAVTAEIDGRAITAPTDFGGEPIKEQKIKTLSIPGTHLDVYKPNSLASHETRYVTIHLLNHGLPQGEMTISLPQAAKIPSNFTVDVRSTGRPESDSYPWLPSREGVRDSVAEQIKKYIGIDMANEAIRAKNDLYTTTMREAPKITGTNHRVVDTSGEIPRPLLERMANDAGIKQLSNTLESLLTRISNTILSQVGGEQSFSGRQYSNYEYGGIGLGREYYGVNITGSHVGSSRGRVILINPLAVIDAANRVSPEGRPFDQYVSPNETAQQALESHNRDYASEQRSSDLSKYTVTKKVESDGWISYTFTPIADPGRFADAVDFAVGKFMGTSVHEITHNTQSGHGEDFAGELTWNLGRTYGNMDVEANKLKELLSANDYAAFKYLLELHGEVQQSLSGREDIFANIRSTDAAESNESKGSEQRADRSAEEDAAGGSNLQPGRTSKTFRVARTPESGGTERTVSAEQPSNAPIPDESLSADARTSAQRYHAWKSASMEEVQRRLGLTFYDDWEAERDKVIRKHAGAFAGQSGAEDYQSAVDRLDALTPDKLAALPEPPAQNAPAAAPIKAPRAPRAPKAPETVEHPTNPELSGQRVGESASGKTVYVQNEAGEIRAPRARTLSPETTLSKVPKLVPIPDHPRMKTGNLRLTDMERYDQPEIKRQMLAAGQDPRSPFNIARFQVEVNPDRHVQLTMSRQGDTAIVANIASPDGQNTTAQEFRTALRSYLAENPKVQRIYGERTTGLTEGKSFALTREQIAGDRAGDLAAIADTLHRASTEIARDYRALVEHRGRGERMPVASESTVGNYFKQLHNFVRIHNASKLSMVEEAESAYHSGNYAKALVLSETALSGTHDYKSMLDGAIMATRAMQKMPDYEPPGGLTRIQRAFNEASRRSGEPIRTFREAVDEAKRRLAESGLFSARGGNQSGAVGPGANKAPDFTKYPKGGLPDHVKIAEAMEPFVDLAKYQFQQLVTAGKSKAADFTNYMRELIQETFRVDPDFSRWHRLNKDSGYGAVMAAVRNQVYDPTVQGYRTVAGGSRYVDDSPLNFQLAATDRETARDIRREVTGDQNKQLAIGNTFAANGKRAVKDKLAQSAIYFYNSVGGNTAKLRAAAANPDARLDAKSPGENFTHREAIQRALHLSDTERSWAAATAKFYDDLGDYSRSLGTIQNVRTNYTNKLYIAEKRGKDFVASEAFRSGMGARTSHAREAIYNDPIDALLGITKDGLTERAGKLLASTNAFTNLSHLNAEMARANTNAKFREAMTRAGLGYETDAGKIPPGYSTIEGMDRTLVYPTHEALGAKPGKGFRWNQGAEEGAAVTHKVYVVPDGIAKGVAALTDADFLNRIKWLGNLERAQSEIKTLKLAFSAFHHLALTAQFVYQTAGTPRGTARNLDTLRTLFKPSNAFDQLEQDFTRHTGITTRVESNADILRSLAQNDDVLSKIHQLPGIKQLDALRTRSTDFLFDNMQRRYKLIDYGMKTAEWLHKNPEANPREIIEAKRSIAKEINNAYGGLNWKALGVTRSNLALMRLFMLAPDWTISNGLILSQAFGGEHAIDAVKARSTSGLGSKVANDPGGNIARRNLLVGGVGSALLTAGLSQVLHGRGTDQNERGHEYELEIAPGVYVSLFRGGISDIVKMYSLIREVGPMRGVTQFGSNKLAPVPRAAVGLLSNASTGKPIYVPYNPSQSWMQNTLNQLKQSGQIVDAVLPAPIGTTNTVSYLRRTDKPTALGLATVVSGLGRATADRGARTPAEKHMAALSDRKGKDIYDDAHEEHYQLRRDLTEKVRVQGDAGIAEAVKAYQAGKIGKADKDAIKADSKLTDFQVRFKHLNDLNDALDVWEKMDAQEQEATSKILHDKIKSAKNQPGQVQDQLLQRLQRLGLMAPTKVSSNRVPPARPNQFDASYRADLRNHLQPSATRKRLAQLLSA